MSVKPRDTRNVIAAIRHDLRAGNIERAQRWFREICEYDGDVAKASPAEIEMCCKAIETKLDEADI